MPTSDRTEAAILRDIAVEFWDVDPARIIVEPDSSNCGENASLSRRALDAQGLEPQRILLIQDPTMQRRTDAAFRHVWRDRPSVRFLNWPTFTPRVREQGDRLVFDVENVAGLWAMNRFLSLLMGEIPRLRNDPQGYGPKGRGFIVAVDIPEEIEGAYRRLATGVCEKFGARAPALGA
ncbi:YdcF family protein [Microvirga brassicacearum]|uniref:YdcF family protein n=1 Tax=Microvirga brassicacearum TaxID=2580413 RepID=A0A5N3P9W3_9HYPH|nr:YdcF family protein [Microvirga brassicacearum]KAB0266542.1 YdcF family protein [Microvirga brassicacearum]